MFVKKLTVEQFGRIGYKSFSFEQPLTIFAGEETEEIFAALCVVLDNRLLSSRTMRYCFTEKSKLYAEIEKDGKVYTAEAAYDESAPNHCVVRIYCGGRLLSNEERTAAFQTSFEEEECSYFLNRYDYYSRYVPSAELGFTKKLADYRQGLQEENRQMFSAWTDGIGLTHTFRKVLKNFCDKFLPQQLRIEKRLWLTMDDEGSFSAKDVSPRKDLSATEDTLLQYFCFLEVNRFWGEVQKAMGRTVQKPLFIGALADNIDFCIDLASLLEKASDLNRQVFVFTRDKNIAERIQETERIMLP